MRDTHSQAHHYGGGEVLAVGSIQPVESHRGIKNTAGIGDVSQGFSNRLPIDWSF